MPSRWATRFAVLVAVMALAGCGTAGEPAAGESPPAPSETSPSPREKDFWLDYTGARAPTCPLAPVACTFDAGHSGRVGLTFCQDAEVPCSYSTFNITLEWSSDNSTSSSLRARFEREGTTLAEASGPSPLTLSPEPTQVVPDVMHVLEVGGETVDVVAAVVHAIRWELAAVAQV